MDKAGYLLKVTYNRFIALKDGGGVYLEDLEHAEVFSPEDAKQIIKSSLLEEWPQRIVSVISAVKVNGVITVGAETNLREIVEVRL